MFIDVFVLHVCRMLSIEADPPLPEPIHIELISSLDTKLLCDHTFVFWGGVCKGDKVSQVIRFRNPSTTQAVSFKARVRGGLSCFKVRKPVHS